MILKGVALLVMSAAAGQLTEISMPRMMELVDPVLKGGVKSNHLKMPEKMVRTGRLSVPMPAMMLFFNDTGCLTAMLGQHELSKVDGKCMEGERVPTINDFLGKDVQTGSQAVIILSPLYNLEALKSVNSSRDAFWNERRVELDRLQVEIQQKYPEAAVHPVYIPFGL